MSRRTDNLAVLAGKVPFIPLSVRSVVHISIEEFEDLDRRGRYLGRVEDDDMVVLYFIHGTVVHSKIGGVVLKHWLKGTPEKEPVLEPTS